MTIKLLLKIIIIIIELNIRVELSCLKRDITDDETKNDINRKREELPNSEIKSKWK